MQFPLQKIKKIIFISQNAVYYFFKALDLYHLTLTKDIEFFAIGKATAKALQQKGIEAGSPSIADSKHLLESVYLQEQEVQSQDILLVKGKDGLTLLEDNLKKRKAKMHIFEIYERKLPSPNNAFTDSLWQNDAVDIILFTSLNSMHNTFTLFGPKAFSWLCQKPCIVLSERIALEALAIGIQQVIISKPEEILLNLYRFNKGLIHDPKRREQ